MKTKTVYVANDGREFSDEKSCKTYESGSLLWEKLEEKFSVYGKVIVPDAEEFIDFLILNKDLVNAVMED